MQTFVYNQSDHEWYRRANFTSADMRESDFSGSTFNGAYLEKAVAYKANFTGSLVAVLRIHLIKDILSDC